MSGPHRFLHTGGNISQLNKLQEEEVEMVMVVEAEKVHLFCNINMVFI